jgi:hypothetical protein
MCARSSVSGKLKASLRKSLGVMVVPRFTKSDMTTQSLDSGNGLSTSNRRAPSPL